MTHFVNYTDYAEIVPGVWRRIKQSFLHSPHGQLLKAQVSYEYFISCIFAIWNINSFNRLTYLSTFLELLVIILYYIYFSVFLSLSLFLSFALFSDIALRFSHFSEIESKEKIQEFHWRDHRRCNKMENMTILLWKEYSFKIVISINVICTLSNVALRILRIHSDTMYVRCTHSESKRFINKVTYQWLVQIIALLPLEL